MVIFHSYVSLPEAIPRLGFCSVLTQDWGAHGILEENPRKTYWFAGPSEEKPPQLDTWKISIFCRQPAECPAKGWRGCRGPPIDKCDPLGPTLASRKHKSAVESAIICVYYVYMYMYPTIYVYLDLFFREIRTIQKSSLFSSDNRLWTSWNQASFQDSGHVPHLECLEKRWMCRYPWRKTLCIGWIDGKPMVYLVFWWWIYP